MNELELKYLKMENEVKLALLRGEISEEDADHDLRNCRFVLNNLKFFTRVYEDAVMELAQIEMADK